VDFFKMSGVTLLMTSLMDSEDRSESTSVNISSIVDAWLALKNDEVDGARARSLSVIKARGMGHSNWTHEFSMSKKGVEIKGDARIGTRA
jgi:circadian clock protein KaiC